MRKNATKNAHMQILNLEDMGLNINALYFFNYPYTQTLGDFDLQSCRNSFTEEHALEKVAESQQPKKLCTKQMQTGDQY